MQSTPLLYHKAHLESNNYEFINYISKGQYSTICKVKKKDQYFAAKIVQQIIMNEEDNYYIDEEMQFNNLLLKQEKRTMKRIKHPNCINIIETIKCNDMHIFIMPLANYNLNSFINIFYQGNPFNNIDESFMQHMNEDLIKYLCNQMIEALSYLQRQNIVHFDIKPENFLCFKNLHLKLADFNLSSRVNSNNHGEYYELLNMGTKGYMGLEMYSQEIKKIPTADCHKVDLFALGCILFKMVYNKAVINTIESDKLKVQMEINKAISHINDNNTYQPSNELRTFICALLQPINNRQTLKELIKDKWRFANKDRIEAIIQINEDYEDKLIIELQKSRYLIMLPKHNRCNIKHFNHY